jgi:hypothetical protein
MPDGTDCVLPAKKLIDRCENRVRPVVLHQDEHVGCVAPSDNDLAGRRGIGRSKRKGVREEIKETPTLTLIYSLVALSYEHKMVVIAPQVALSYLIGVVYANTQVSHCPLERTAPQPRSIEDERPRVAPKLGGCPRRRTACRLGDRVPEPPGVTRSSGTGLGPDESEPRSSGRQRSWTG